MNGDPNDAALPGGKRAAFNLFSLSGHFVVSLAALGAVAWIVALSVSGTPVGDTDLSLGLYVITMEARLVLLIFGGIAFLAWFHRSYSNIRLLGGSTRHSPAYVTWSLFIPIVGLFKPYQAAQEMWNNSEPPGTASPRRSSLILAWWLSFVAWWGVYFVALDEMPEQALPSVGWWSAMLLAEVLAVAASGLALLWVWRLRQRQKAQAQVHRTAHYAVAPAPLPRHA